MNKLPMRIASIILIACIGFGFLFFYTNLATDMTGTTFRGFLVSKSLRVSEFNLPEWQQFQKRIPAGSRVVALDSTPLTSIDDLHRIEKNIHSGESHHFQFIFPNGKKQSFEVTYTKFDFHDLLLTYGILAFSVVSMLILLIPTLFFCRRNWILPLGYYAILGTTWLCGTFDYYTFHRLTWVPIFSGAFLPSVVLHLAFRIFNLKPSRLRSLTLKFSYLVSCSLGLFHWSFHDHATSPFANLSLTLLWIQGGLAGLWVVIMSLRRILRKETRAYDKIKAWLMLVSHSIFYIIPITTLLLNLIFHFHIQLSHFTPIFSLAPLCIFYLCLSERYFLLSQKFERKMLLQDHFATIGALSAGISHEINNPLHIISLNNHLLGTILQDSRVPMSPSAREKCFKTLGKIKSNVERIHDITQSITGISKGSLVVRNEVSLREMIHHVLMSTQEAAQKKSIVIHLTYRGMELVEIAETAVRQVLENLLTNAIQNSPDHATIDIEVDSSLQGIHISITDHGSGIPQHLKHRIFDPFFTTKPEGTGLGLWITSRIIEAHGGTIQLDSVPYDYTRFTVNIPQDWRDKQFENDNFLHHSDEPFFGEQLA